jgi:23S rRNA (uracil1939-C5)-methyltransferase
MVTRSRSSHGEARVLELLEPSPDRVGAPCADFGSCGGCAYQTLDYPAQLRQKRDLVRDPLQRIGGLESLEVAPCLPSPDIWNYRNKMEFSFARRRWLRPEELNTGVDGDLGAALGLHVPRVFDKVIEIGECHIQDPRANAVLEATRTFARASNLPAYDTRSRQGYWRFLVIRTGRQTGEIMINLVTAFPQADVAAAWAAMIREQLPDVDSLLNGIAPRPASAVILDEIHLLHGREHILERLGDLHFEISPSAFFQPNTRAAELLYLEVEKRTGDLQGKVLFDLYCGTGTIALFLARSAAKVVGLELSEAAIANARQNAARNQIYNAAFTAGDVRGTLANAVRRHGVPDVVVLDPPRAGNHPKFLQALIELAPPRIVHVSCNPSTLARDLALLVAAGYTPEEAQPVDLFPHTPHVETVIALRR